MTHTPGPWTAHDDDGTGTLPCVLSDKVNASGTFYVAQCNVWDDARLIAKAPEMLEAFEGLVEAIKAMQLACDEWAAEFTQKKRAMDWGVVNDAYVKASRAIRKAEGRETR